MARRRIGELPLLACAFCLSLLGASLAARQVKKRHRITVIRVCAGDEKRIIPNGRLRLLSTYYWLSRRAMFAEVDLDHQDPVMTSHLRAREDCTHQQA
jgi:hypothetical protein